MLVLFGSGLAFIKSRKTAGTSVEIWLSQFMEPGDIATPIASADEPARVGTRAPCNYQGRWVPGSAADDHWLPPRARRVAGVMSHSAARDAAAFVGERWGELTSFTIERNPWERMVSLYHWRTRNMAHPPPLDQFIRERPPRDLSNSHLYMDRSGDLLVDHVLEYSDLADGLGRVAAGVGLPPPDLPRAKSGHRPREATPERNFTRESRDYIGFACAREIELFGYQPPELMA